MCPLRLAAGRIRARQPVGDHYLRGERRQQLIRDHGITDADLEPYDLYMTAHMQYVYGKGEQR
jgi:hypothetical protein